MNFCTSLLDRGVSCSQSPPSGWLVSEAGQSQGSGSSAHWYRSVHVLLLQQHDANNPAVKNSSFVSSMVTTCSLVCTRCTRCCRRDHELGKSWLLDTDRQSFPKLVLCCACQMKWSNTLCSKLMRQQQLLLQCLPMFIHVQCNNSSVVHHRTSSMAIQ